MKALKIVITVLIALALALGAALLIVNLIEKGNSDLQDSSLPVSAPSTPDDSADIPQAENLDEEDFLAYINWMGDFVNTPVESTAELRLGGGPLAPLFVAWYWAVQNDQDDNLVPYADFDKASEDILGIIFERNTEAFGDWEETGFRYPITGFIGYYFKADESTISFDGDTITVEAEQGHLANIDDDEPSYSELYRLRYTFLYRPEQSLTPYQLQRIELLETIVDPATAGSGFDTEGFLSFLDQLGMYINQPIGPVSGLQSIDDLESYSWNWTQFLGLCIIQSDSYEATEQDGPRTVDAALAAEGSLQLFGIDFGFPNGIEIADGYDLIGAPYIVVDESTLQYNDGLITVEADRYTDAYTGELDYTVTGRLRYTFSYRPDQSITPYRLTNVEEI